MYKRIAFVLLIIATLSLSGCGELFDTIIDTANEVDSGVTERDTERETIRESNQPVKGLEVHFIDVGQGDAILLRTDDTTVLVDAGDWKGNEVVPYLESQGIENIDMIIGTHEHADHIGQIDKVIDSFPVKEVWMPGNEHTSQTYERILTGIHDNGIAYHEPRAGEIYDIGDILFEVYNPHALTGEYNEDSIVVKATYDNVSFMLTGDAETRAEADMLEAGQDLKATILKAGHHGSKTSSTKEFVKAVDPEIVIMSYGETNSYYHPHPTTLSTFKSMGIDMYGTASHGTIIVSTDGQTFNIETQKDGIIKQGGE